MKVKAGDKLDIKVPKGASGGTITYQGRKIAKVEIRLRMWDPDQYADWQSIVRSLWPDARRGSRQPGKPLAIDHAKTDAYGISSVVIEDVTDDAGEEGFTGLYEVTLSCVEFRPPPKQAATATATKAIKPQDNALTGSSATPPAKPSATGNRP